MEYGQFTIPQDICPQCKSDDLTNEGPPENGFLFVSCLHCGYAWHEPDGARQEALPLVAYVVDDAGCARRLGADIHAIVRETGNFRHPSRLVGFVVDGSPLYVAVHSYLDGFLGDDEAKELAADYLAEIGISAEPIGVI